MLRVGRKFFMIGLSVLFLTTACAGQGTSPSPAPAPAPAPAVTPAPAPAPKINFPTKAIKVVVSHAAGGSTDVPGRMIAPYASAILGQPFVLENMVGAGGVLARNFVYKAAPDGYTLIQTQIPSMDMAPYLSVTEYESLKFEPVYTITGKDYLATAVKVSSPHTTLKGFIEALPKDNSSIAGAAGASQILVTQYRKIGGDTLVYVPFNSSAEAATALAGGHVDIVTTNLSTLGPMAEKGLIKIITVHSDERHPDYPNLSTAVEAGYPDLVVPQVTALWAPPGTDPAIVKILADALVKAGQDPKYLDDLTKAKLLPDPRGPEEFKKFHKTVNDSIAKIGDLLKQYAGK